MSFSLAKLRAGSRSSSLYNTQALQRFDVFNFDPVLWTIAPGMLQNANGYLVQGFSTKEIYTPIDRDIKNHEMAIAMLKNQRNEAAPISRLPPEVLCRIFLLVRDNEVERNNTYLYTEFRRWIYLGHVSKHWRNVVFTLPSLWNNSPPLGLLHWIDEVLKRSPKIVACLSIIVDIDYAPSIWGLKKIMSHDSSGIRDLSILNMRSKHQGLLESLQISTLALHLEYLRIIRHDGISYRLTHDQDQYSLPDAIVANAINLCHLELDHCKIDWGLPTLPHITRLSLQDVRYNNVDSSFTHFMDALGKMANLQYLSLKNSLPGASDFEFMRKVDPVENPDSRKTFPHLRKLVFAGESSQVNAFFQGCCFPSSVKVCVDIHRSKSPETNSSNLPDLSRVFLSIAAATGCPASMIPENSRPRTLVVDSINETDDQTLILVLLAETQYGGTSDELAYQLSIACLVLTVEYAVLDDNNMSSGQTLRAFFGSGFLLQDVSHVYLLNILKGVESIALAETIGILPAVSYVKAEGDLAAPLVDAVDPTSAIFNVSTPGTLYFPSLECLHLEEAVFPSTREFSNDHDAMEALQDCIVQRLNRGFPLCKIILSDCDEVTEGDVAKLQEMIVEVEWEEDPDWEQDEDEDDCPSYGSSSDEDADGDSDRSDDSFESATTVEDIW